MFYFIISFNNLISLNNLYFYAAAPVVDFDGNNNLSTDALKIIKKTKTKLVSNTFKFEQYKIGGHEPDNPDDIPDIYPTEALDRNGISGAFKALTDQLTSLQHSLTTRYGTVQQINLTNITDLTDAIFQSNINPGSAIPVPPPVIPMVPPPPVPLQPMPVVAHGYLQQIPPIGNINISQMQPEPDYNVKTRQYLNPSSLMVKHTYPNDSRYRSILNLYPKFMQLESYYKELSDRKKAFPTINEKIHKIIMKIYIKKIKDLITKYKQDSSNPANKYDDFQKLFTENSNLIKILEDANHENIRLFQENQDNTHEILKAKNDFYNAAINGAQFNNIFNAAKAIIVNNNATITNNNTLINTKISEYSTNITNIQNLIIVLNQDISKFNKTENEYKTRFDKINTVIEREIYSHPNVITEFNKLDLELQYIITGDNNTGEPTDNQIQVAEQLLSQDIKVNFQKYESKNQDIQTNLPQLNTIFQKKCNTLSSDVYKKEKEADFAMLAYLGLLLLNKENDDDRKKIEPLLLPYFKNIDSSNLNYVFNTLKEEEGALVSNLDPHTNIASRAFRLSNNDHYRLNNAEKIATRNRFLCALFGCELPEYQGKVPDIDFSSNIFGQQILDTLISNNTIEDKKIQLLKFDRAATFSREVKKIDPQNLYCFNGADRHQHITTGRTQEERQNEIIAHALQYPDDPLLEVFGALNNDINKFDTFMQDIENSGYGESLLQLIYAFCGKKTNLFVYSRRLNANIQHDTQKNIQHLKAFIEVVNLLKTLPRFYDTLNSLINIIFEYDSNKMISTDLFIIINELLKKGANQDLIMHALAKIVEVPNTLTNEYIPYQGGLIEPEDLLDNPVTDTKNQDVLTYTWQLNKTQGDRAIKIFEQSALFNDTYNLTSIAAIDSAILIQSSPKISSHNFTARSIDYQANKLKIRTLVINMIFNLIDYLVKVQDLRSEVSYVPSHLIDPVGYLISLKLRPFSLQDTLSFEYNQCSRSLEMLPTYLHSSENTSEIVTQSTKNIDSALSHIGENTNTFIMSVFDVNIFNLIDELTNQKFKDNGGYNPNSRYTIDIKTLTNIPKSIKITDQTPPLIIQVMQLINNKLINNNVNNFHNPFQESDIEILHKNIKILEHQIKQIDRLSSAIRSKKKGKRKLNDKNNKPRKSNKGKATNNKRPKDTETQNAHIYKLKLELEEEKLSGYTNKKSNDQLSKKVEKIIKLKVDDRESDITKQLETWKEKEKIKYKKILDENTKKLAFAHNTQVKILSKLQDSVYRFNQEYQMHKLPENDQQLLYFLEKSLSLSLPNLKSAKHNKQMPFEVTSDNKIKIDSSIILSPYSIEDLNHNPELQIIIMEAINNPYTDIAEGIYTPDKSSDGYKTLINKLPTPIDKFLITPNKAKLLNTMKQNEVERCIFSKITLPSPPTNSFAPIHKYKNAEFRYKKQNLETLFAIYVFDILKISSSFNIFSELKDRYIPSNTLDLFVHEFYDSTTKQPKILTDAAQINALINILDDDTITQRHTDRSIQHRPYTIDFFEPRNLDILKKLKSPKEVSDYIFEKIENMPETTQSVKNKKYLMNSIWYNYRNSFDDNANNKKYIANMCIISIQDIPPDIIDEIKSNPRYLEIGDCDIHGNINIDNLFKEHHPDIDQNTMTLYANFCCTLTAGSAIPNVHLEVDDQILDDAGNSIKDANQIKTMNKKTFKDNTKKIYQSDNNTAINNIRKQQKKPKNKGAKPTRGSQKYLFDEKNLRVQKINKNHDLSQYITDAINYNKQKIDYIDKKLEYQDKAIDSYIASDIQDLIPLLKACRTVSATLCKAHRDIIPIIKTTSLENTIAQTSFNMQLYQEEQEKELAEMLELLKCDPVIKESKGAFDSHRGNFLSNKLYKSIIDELEAEIQIAKAQNQLISLDNLKREEIEKLEKLIVSDRLDSSEMKKKRDEAQDIWKDLSLYKYSKKDQYDIYTNITFENKKIKTILIEDNMNILGNHFKILEELKGDLPAYNNMQTQVISLMSQILTSFNCSTNIERPNDSLHFEAKKIKEDLKKTQQQIEQIINDFSVIKTDPSIHTSTGIIFDNTTEVNIENKTFFVFFQLLKQYLKQYIILFNSYNQSIPLSFNEQQDIEDVIYTYQILTSKISKYTEPENKTSIPILHTLSDQDKQYAIEACEIHIKILNKCKHNSQEIVNELISIFNIPNKNELAAKARTFIQEYEKELYKQNNPKLIKTYLNCQIFIDMLENSDNMKKQADIAIHNANKFIEASIDIDNNMKQAKESLISQNKENAGPPSMPNIPTDSAISQKFTESEKRKLLSKNNINHSNTQAQNTAFTKSNILDYITPIALITIFIITASIFANNKPVAVKS